MRHHGDVARVELLPQEMLAAVQQHEEVDRVVREAGFRFAAMDLRGIQSGAFTLPLVSVTHG